MQISMLDTYNRSTKYPPSILMVAERNAPGFRLEQALENNGCQVYWAEASGEALDKARQTDFDLVILDIDLSVQNSLNLYQKLKSYPELAGLSTVVLAPDQRLSHKLSGFEGGLVHFLVKGSGIEARLLQLIQLVHYLRDRYWGLAL